MWLSFVPSLLLFYSKSKAAGSQPRDHLCIHDFLILSHLFPVLSCRNPKPPRAPPQHQDPSLSLSFSLMLFYFRFDIYLILVIVKKNILSLSHILFYFRFDIYLILIFAKFFFFDKLKIMYINLDIVIPGSQFYPIIFN